MIDCIPISINIKFFNQFGFKEKSSTSDAVGELSDKMAKNTDNKQATCSVFLDLKKAFDTVNHKILLLKTRKLQHLWVASSLSLS